MYYTSDGVVLYQGDMKVGDRAATQEEVNIFTQEAEEAKAIAEAKEAKLKALNELTVTTTNGNEFQANDEARANMNEAITASEVLGLVGHSWKLADNSIVVVSLDELKEALALGIQAKGAIILGT